MQRLITQGLRIMAWFSQTVNVWLLFGHHDQTVSARCFVNQAHPLWGVAYRLINRIFFWQEDHCERSYLADVSYAQEFLQTKFYQKDALTWL